MGLGIKAEISFQEARGGNPSQIEEICKLVNSAYRGDSGRAGWTTESEILDGQRTDRDEIAEILQKKDSVILLALKKEEILGCVHLAVQGQVCYLGMLTVKPTLQGEGLGKKILNQAEIWAMGRACAIINMTVITARAELIAWYERRGYHRTGQFEKFPYGNERFGIPKVSDLQFEYLSKQVIP